MAVGNHKKLEREFARILQTGKGDAEDLAKQLAKAVEEYVESITFEIPMNSVVTLVTGQAVGTKNVNPIKVTLK